MSKTCFVCGFNTESNLIQCTGCGAKLEEIDEEIYTCSDCARFTGFECTVYPASQPHVITGPPQCSAFQLRAPDKPAAPKVSTLTLKDIEDIQKLDKHEDDATFLLNVPEANLHFYQAAAKETGASVAQEPATLNNGEIYDKHPIFALFLVGGATKEDYLKEVRRQIKKNRPPPMPKMPNLDYAKMEKDIASYQGISKDDPYNIGEDLDEDDGWEDYEPFEDEYKYDEGFIQNIQNEEQVVYKQAASNLGIEVELKEGATDIHGQPMPDHLEIYFVNEKDREKTHELFDETRKIRKQIELTKPSTPKEYTFPLAVHFDPNEVFKTVKESIDTPIISFECTPIFQGGYELRFVFKNELEKVEYDFLALIVVGQYKEGAKAVKPGEQNPEIASFSKSLKEGMEDPDPILNEILKEAENTPDLFAQAQEGLKQINEKVHGEYRFYWSKKPPKNVPFCIIMEKHLNNVLSVPVKNIHMHEVDEVGCVDFKFVESLPPSDLNILKGNAKDWDLLEEPPTPKEKAYYLPPDMKKSIQNMFSKEDLKEAQAWLSKEMTKHKPNTPAAKSHMMLKILNKMSLKKKKKLDEKVLEQSKDLGDDLFIPASDKDVDLLTSSNQSFSEQDVQELQTQFFKSAKVPKDLFESEPPKQTFKLKDFVTFITVTAEDAPYYEAAAKSLKMQVIVSKAKTSFGGAAALFDVKVHRGEADHRAGKFLDLASSLKIEGVSDPNLKPIQRGVKKKCKKRKPKPGQRKVRFKKGPGKD